MLNSMDIKTATLNGVATIEIARPHKKNALTAEMYSAMAAALRAADADTAVRALLITGQPGCFTSGNDIEDFMQAPPGQDGEPPPVARFNNDNSQPIVVLALLSPTRSARELSLVADQQIDKRLQRVEGVARIDISGLATREVRIDLDPARLRSYGVTPAEVATALREANADQPVGLLSDRSQDAILRVEGRVRDPRDFAALVVARRGGENLRLRVEFSGQA
jgi:hypothetical protein